MLAGCGGKESPVPADTGKDVIALSAGIEGIQDSKGLINNLVDLAQDGFVVWGAWEQDPTDKSMYSGDYTLGFTNRVFGLKGTKVYYPDWKYAPQRYWTRGTYSFAAALPASAFNCDHALNDDKTGSAGINGQISNDGVLTLGNWDLKENQIDLMVAFDDADNKDESRTDEDKVSLRFEHQLAQIAFKAKFADDNQSAVEIKSITIYGNTRTATQATFACNDNGTETKDDDQITASWILGAKATSKTDYFAQKSGSWSTSGSTLMEGVLVFPEAYTFTIVVDYIESYGGASATVSQSGSLSGTWEAAQKYVYEFTLSSKNIIFSEPVVTPWGDGGKADVIDPM